MFCSSLASRGMSTSYGPHTYVYMSDRWSGRNGTGYWMVGPVDDISDKVEMPILSAKHISNLPTPRARLVVLFLCTFAVMTQL